MGFKAEWASAIDQDQEAYVAIRGRSDLSDVYDGKSYAAGQTHARALKAT